MINQDSHRLLASDRTSPAPLPLHALIISSLKIVALALILHNNFILTLNTLPIFDIFKPVGAVFVPSSV